MAKAKKRAATAIKSTDGFELIGGGGGEIQLGEVVTGVYGGVVRTLPAKRKGQPPLPIFLIGDRTVLGGTVLRQRFEEGKVKEGDTVRLTRLEDAPAKAGHNPAKVFKVEVKRS